MSICSTRNIPNQCDSFMTADQARRSTCDRLVWLEIFLIQNLILDAVDNCENCVTISNLTPITSFSEIETITITNGGTGYQPVIAQADISHPNGSGEEIEVLVSPAGEIIGFNIVNGGVDFEPVLASANATGVGNGDATFNVFTDADGEITLVSVVNPGTGYAIGNSIPIVHPTGTGAIVTVASVGGSGEVLSTVVSNSGSNYLPVNATITINHPTGFGFEGLVNTNAGVITGISILDGGSNYFPLGPTVTTDGIGTGLELSFTIDDTTGEITDITVINGGIGYAVGDELTVVSPIGGSGSGATIEFSLLENQGSCQDLWQFVNTLLYYQVWVGDIENSSISSQINFIKNYFECLGYTFRVEVNPETGNTLQWNICW